MDDTKVGADKKDDPAEVAGQRLEGGAEALTWIGSHANCSVRIYSD